MFWNRSVRGMAASAPFRSFQDVNLRLSLLDSTVGAVGEMDSSALHAVYFGMLKKI